MNSDNELLRAAWDSQTMTLDHTQTFQRTPGPITDLSVYTYRRLPLRDAETSDEPATAIMVDGHTFAVLGVMPAMGRLPSVGRVLWRREARARAKHRRRNGIPREGLETDG